MDSKTFGTSPGASFSLGLLGAVLGGTVGHFVFGWLYHQGFMAAALPGALLGIGCGFLVKHRLLSLAIFCGILGLGLDFFSTWYFAYKNYELGYFLTHLSRIQPFEILLLVLGGVFAFWFSLGRRRQIVVAPANPS